MRRTRLGLAVCSVALVLVAVGGFTQAARAEVRLPKVFSSHMVLQQDKPLVIWGWAEPNETVTVALSTGSRQVQANERGEWKTVLPAMKTGGPYTLTVSGSTKVHFEDVMIGEVWLCSGQSNMEMGIGMARDAQKEIAAADYPGIRLLKVTKSWKPEPQNDIEGTWKVCSPKTVAEGGWSGFSACGYYFGRELHQKLGVAVGLIDASWGGTRIEPWTPPEGFAAVPALKKDYERVELGDPRTALHQQRLEQVLKETERWLAAARQALTDRALVPTMPAYPAELLAPHDVQNPTALYNGMIHPLHPFALRGAIWYQGESNSTEGMLYAERMKALIGGWRQVWGEGDFPFYFVQIAPFTYGHNPEVIGEFWEAQTAAQAVPNTGMAVINDIGNLKDIHPANKQEVGRRLALWALAKTYGQENLVYSGPTFKAMTIEGDKLRLTFDPMGGGLASRDGKPLSWFEVIDADEGGFVKADARIDGTAVVLSAPSVKHPVAMRFAWSMLAEPNLMNAEGLPAGAFRAGTVPKRDSLLKAPKAKDHQ
ncbi:MAG: sialate O-acetylesterase [Verrucomicrobiota bacterium]